jgi:LDH2 family malate/lactate/ureidoglycolate dehydrogenase
MSNEETAANIDAVNLYFTPKSLHNFCHKLLVALGCPPAHADIVVESLVAANLRAVDSHGVQMLIPYIQRIKAKGTDIQSEGRIVSGSGGCLLYDGQNGFGQVIADRCIKLTKNIADESGISIVVANRSTHFGAAAYWVEQLVQSNLIGIVMSNASPAVAPWQSSSPRLGTNPISVGVPGTDSGRWLLDMATTTVALGKVSHAANLGQDSIPPEWGFLDSDGLATTSTRAALLGSPTPIGGYKGTGLAMMVEMLCAVLSGDNMSLEVPVDPIGDTTLGVSHTFIAIDPGRFMPLNLFRERVSQLVEMVKSADPTNEFDEVLVAGDIEWRNEVARNKSGIPIPERVWHELSVIAEDLGVNRPEPG